MKYWKAGWIGFFCAVSLAHVLKAENEQTPRIEAVAGFSVGGRIGNLRAVPVQMSRDAKGILVGYSADKEIDPWEEMFYPPTDRFVLALYSLDGELVWKKELGAGNIGGAWFLPVFPFDLDGDGSDEIYFVNNTDEAHVLSLKQRRLEALDSRSGETIGYWPWHNEVMGESISHMYRFFIFGGYVKGEPVLITAQGTYQRMGLQAWNQGMAQRWNLVIASDEPGARGSHMTPVVDIDADGIDEIMWGERCVSIDDGNYLFVADKDVYNGHSDVIQPTLDRATGEWSIFTCRESGANGQIKPRVVMFDHKGERIWTDLEEGHMDMGWTAHVDAAPLSVVAFTISLGGKIAGPQGFFRLDVREYAYEAMTGRRIDLPFNAYNTVPVDLDGDGYHEFACALGEQSDRKIYTFSGEVIGDLGEGAYVGMASKFLDLPGEQLLCYYPDGTVRVWADRNANDSEIAAKRYSSPYYRRAQLLTAQGYNLVNLGGL